MARTASTLIYVSRRTVARADFGGGTSAGFWLRPRSDQPELSAAVELAISLGPALGRRVWVLTTEVWTQTLIEPANKIVGLSEQDLAHALNFEVESHSGVSALESTLALVRLPTVAGNREARFWVSQISLDHRDEIEDVLRRENSQLAGMLHPAGLPTNFGPPQSSAPIGRLELWPDTVFGTMFGNNAASAIRIWNADPSTDRWQADAREWRESCSDSSRLQWLSADGYAAPPGLSSGKSLDEEGNLAAWLNAWMNVLSSRRPPVPIIRPAPLPMSVGRRRMISAALGILVALALWAHSSFADRQIVALQNEAKNNSQKARQRDALQAQIKSMTADLEKTRKKRDEYETRIDTLNARRVRFAELMKLLSTTRPEDVVIQSIEQNGGATKVVGMTLRPELADAYSRSLHGPLRAMGWEVQPANETAEPQLSAESSGLWKFELVVRDRSTPKLATAPALPGR